MTPKQYGIIASMSESGDDEAKSFLKRKPSPDVDEAYEFIRKKGFGKFIGKKIREEEKNTLASEKDKWVQFSNDLYTAISQNKNLSKKDRQLVSNLKEYGQLSVDDKRKNEFIELMKKHPRLGIDMGGGKLTKKEHPKVTFVMGMGGSGKSTWIKKNTKDFDFVVLDADVYRNVVPQYAKDTQKSADPMGFGKFGFEMKTNGAVEEVADSHDYLMVCNTQDAQKSIMKPMKEWAMENKYDVFYPTVGEEPAGMAKKIQEFINNGYEVEVIHKDAPPINEYIKRTEERPRYIGIGVIIQGAMSSLSYETLKQWYEKNKGIKFKRVEYGKSN